MTYATIPVYMKAPEATVPRKAAFFVCIFDQISHCEKGVGQSICQSRKLGFSHDKNKIPPIPYPCSVAVYQIENCLYSYKVVSTDTSEKSY